ncbi:MAG TPA: hypothetical protein VI197_19615 [Polyangiaceae bacterium]
MWQIRGLWGIALMGSLGGCAAQSMEEPAQGDGKAAPVAASEACSAAPRGSLKPETEAAFQDLIVGSWLLCSPESTFGTTDEQGLVIYSDYRWAKLFDEGAGELVPGVGWGLEGTWESLDTSDVNGPGVYQLNLNIDGSGTVITIPVLAEEPVYMRLDNNGVFVGDYVQL